MVAAGPVTPFSSHYSASRGGGGQSGSPGAEPARIKAEILSARSEKQCTTCEGDKEKLDQKIRELESQLRRVESAGNISRPNQSDPSRRSDGQFKASQTVVEPSKLTPSSGSLTTREPEPGAKAASLGAANRDGGPGQLVDVVA